MFLLCKFYSLQKNLLEIAAQRRQVKAVYVVMSSLDTVATKSMGTIWNYLFSAIIGH